MADTFSSTTGVLKIVTEQEETEEVVVSVGVVSPGDAAPNEYAE